LSFSNGDLKDIQRPWVLDQIKSLVSIGSHCVEIGGGDPHVAHLLTQIGYKVTVIDPYDGRHGGPSNIKEYINNYPDIDFIQGEFPSATRSFAHGIAQCVYSISVLEHIPGNVAKNFSQEIKRLTSGKGVTIHSIDHVLLGHGSEFHRDNLAQWCESFGITADTLSRKLTEIDADPDCYFLSAESHEKWRGLLSYEKFPMRRVVSINIKSGTEQLLDV
jgi:hypothetical protein